MNILRLSLQRSYPTEKGHATSFATLAFLKRDPWTLIIAAGGRGINLHRKGGLSLSGMPRSGGTTLCWGQLRKRCERMDSELREGCCGHGRPDALVRCLGPFMLRVGSDF